MGGAFKIPLPEIPITEGDENCRLISPSNLRKRFPRRDFETRKGTAGRVSVIAGSRGLTGAAVLAATGASRTGAGLVSFFVPEDIHSIVATKCPAEIMVRLVSDFSEIKDHPTDVLSLAPVLGITFLQKLWIWSQLTVVDADALNSLARSPDLLLDFPLGKRLLKPHPGELSRLTRDNSEPNDRVSFTRELAENGM